jgi:hypothetical protein
MPPRRKIMKQTIVSTLASLLALSAITLAQAPQNPPPAPGQPGGGLAYAFDITKAEVDMVNKNDPTTDRQLRVVDMGSTTWVSGLSIAALQTINPATRSRRSFITTLPRSTSSVRRGRPHNGRGDRQFQTQSRCPQRHEWPPQGGAREHGWTAT